MIDAETVRKTGACRVREEDGSTVVRVRAKTVCKDNGVDHAPGETFEMELSLVPGHVAAGQVELAAKPEPAGPKARADA